VTTSSPYHPRNDPVKYGYLPASCLPVGESLEATRARVLPVWTSAIKPLLAAGQTVLVAAHGNSLRALLMELDAISPDDIPGVAIANGSPLVYELDASLAVLPRLNAVAPLRGEVLAPPDGPWNEVPPASISPLPSSGAEVIRARSSSHPSPRTSTQRRGKRGVRQRIGRNSAGGEQPRIGTTR